MDSYILYADIKQIRGVINYIYIYAYIFVCRVLIIDTTK